MIIYESLSKILCLCTITLPCIFKHTCEGTYVCSFLDRKLTNRVEKEMKRFLICLAVKKIYILKRNYFEVSEVATMSKCGISVIFVVVALCSFLSSFDIWSILFLSQCFRLIRLIDHLILQFLLPHWNRYSLLIKRKHIFVHWGRNYTLFYRHFYFGNSYKGRYAHLVLLSFLHYRLLEQLSSNSSTNMFWYVTSMFWIA